MKKSTVPAIVIGAVALIAIFIGLGKSQPQDDIRVVVNTMSALLDDAQTIYFGIDEALQSSVYSDIAEHASQIEKLAQEIRKKAVVLSDFEIISRDVSEIQHTADELGDASKQRKHEETHHAAETLKRYLDILEKDIQNIRRNLGV